jgi:hypothetical protein
VSARRKRQQRQRPADLEWDFFSFPTYFGFALGGLVSVLLFPLFPLPVFVVFLFGTSFGVAHIMSAWFRRRVTNKRREREEEEERERRALAARSAASLENEAQSRRRRRKRA